MNIVRESPYTHHEVVSSTFRLIIMHSELFQDGKSECRLWVGRGVGKELDREKLLHSTWRYLGAFTKTYSETVNTIGMGDLKGH